MDFDVQDFEENTWGRVRMSQDHGGMNQRWVFKGNEIVCKTNPSLRLDVFQNEADPNESKKPGMAHSYNQKWFCLGECSKLYLFIYIYIS